VDNLLKNGNMVSDFDGSVQTVSGVKELAQAAMIRLTVRRGSFPYNQSLGSGLFDLDVHAAGEEEILSVVEEALQDMDEVVVMGIEKKTDQEKRILYLQVNLRINGEEQSLGVMSPFWEG
jgi:hypothetical protein